jgi:hypothetical protein
MCRHAANMIDVGLLDQLIAKVGVGDQALTRPDETRSSQTEAARRTRPAAPASARAARPGVDALFTTEKPIIFNYHGSPYHGQLHVRGYVEEGTTATPFDMCVRDRIDWFNIAIDAIDRAPRLRPISAHYRERLRTS